MYITQLATYTVDPLGVPASFVVDKAGYLYNAPADCFVTGQCS